MDIRSLRSSDGEKKEKKSFLEAFVKSSLSVVKTLWKSISSSGSKKRKRRDDVVSSVREVKKKRKIVAVHSKVLPPPSPLKVTSKYENIPAVFRPSKNTRGEEEEEVRRHTHHITTHHTYFPYYVPLPPPRPPPMQRILETNIPPQYYGSPFEPLCDWYKYDQDIRQRRNYQTPIVSRTTKASMKSPMQRAYEADFDIAFRSTSKQQQQQQQQQHETYDHDGEDAIRDLRVSTNRSIVESWGRYDNEIMTERRHLVDMTRRIIDMEEEDMRKQTIDNDDDDDDDNDDNFEFLSELQTTMARQEKENIGTSDEESSTFSFAQRGRATTEEEDEEEEEENCIFFQDLPFFENEIDIARDAFDESKDDDEELGTLGKQFVTRRKIRCLKNGEWLNDEVINFMMETCKSEDVFVFNSFLYSILMQNDVYDYKRVRRWTKRRKIDVFKFNKLLIPINLPGHWSLIVIDMTRKAFIYLDSMNKHGTSGLDVIQNLKRWLEDESMDKRKIKLEDIENWDVQIRTDVPQQNNNYDCGMYATKFAQFVSEGKDPDFDADEIPRFRAEYVLKIMSYYGK